MALRMLNRLWVKTRSCLESMDMPSHYSPSRKLENTSGKVTPVLWRKRYYLINLYLKLKLNIKNVSSTYGYSTGINPVVLVSFLSVPSGIIVRLSRLVSLKFEHLFIHAAFQPKPCEIQMFVVNRSRRDYSLSNAHNTYLLLTKFVSLLQCRSLLAINRRGKTKHSYLTEGTENTRCFLRFPLHFYCVLDDWYDF